MEPKISQYKRPFFAKAGAAFQRRHWVSLVNSFKYVRPSMEHVCDYTFMRSAGYPKDTHIKTPIGEIHVQMFVPDDRLTVNEIFCRLDYEVEPSIKTVVDFGSNVGISALYFLSRNSDAFIYLYEPNPKNVEKLQKQLANFDGRFTLNTLGVAPEAGTLTFGFEPTGRYGGAGLNYAEKLDVKVVEAEETLAEIISVRGFIDVLKVDIESLEEEVLSSLSSQTLKRIKTILLELEGDPSKHLLSETHTRRRYGPIVRFELQ